MRPITSERYPLARVRVSADTQVNGGRGAGFLWPPAGWPGSRTRWRALGSRCVRAIRYFVVRATLPEPLAALRALMLNLRWSWHSGTRELFAAIDPAKLGRGRPGPDRPPLLGEVPPEHLARLAADPATSRGSVRQPASWRST